MQVDGHGAIAAVIAGMTVFSFDGENCHFCSLKSGAKFNQWREGSEKGHRQKVVPTLWSTEEGSQVLFYRGSEVNVFSTPSEDEDYGKSFILQ